jgi:hypothetical protein
MYGNHVATKAFFTIEPSQSYHRCIRDTKNDATELFMAVTYSSRDETRPQLCLADVIYEDAGRMYRSHDPRSNDPLFLHFDASIHKETLYPNRWLINQKS